MIHEVLETFSPELNQKSRPVIPENVYKQIKRCPSCQSVFLTDTSCEACGRSLLFHPIGSPFSAKSLYGFKERYYASFPFYIKYFPFFEDKTSASASTYIRYLERRFDDLLNAFGNQNTIETTNRRFFYVEMMELIDELLRYGTNSILLQSKIENKILELGPLLNQELLLYLNESKTQNTLSIPWQKIVMNHRLGGVRVETALKALLTAATVIAIAVNYYGVISLQFGK